MIPAAVFALILLMGCAANPPRRSDPGRPVDTRFGELLARERLGEALLLADSLIGLKEPVWKEIGLYWKGMAYLHMPGGLDSAEAVFNRRQGKWLGSIRSVHAEALLALIQDIHELNQNRNQAGSASQASNGGNVKSLQARIDVLQKQNAELKAGIAELEANKLKYQKLLKDLETIK